MISGFAAFIVALVTAIVALNISAKAFYVENVARQFVWLGMAGLVFSLGVALVHLLATLSLGFPVDLTHNIPLVLLTLGLAMAGIMTVLYYVNQKKLTVLRLFLSGTVLGLGTVVLFRNWFISIGLEISALNEFSILCFLIIITTLTSMAVVWIVNHLRMNPKTSYVRKNGASGVVISIGMMGFYYSVTLATTVFSKERLATLGGTSLNQFFLAYAIGLFTIVVLGYILIREYMGRKLMFQRQKRIESDRKYASLFQHTHDAIIVLSHDATVVEINPAGLAMLGYVPEELEEIRLESLVLPEYAATTRQYFNQTFRGESNNYDIAVTAKSGDVVYINVTNVPIYSEQQIIGAYFICRDTTDRVKAEMQIEYMAYHDALTGLANLRLFRKKVEQAIIEAQKQEQTFAILFLDMDHFKEVNDTLGHAYGDLLLQLISRRLENLVGTRGTVARRGGDEFTALVRDVTREQAESIAKNIVQEIAEPYDLKGSVATVTTCVGIALYPEHGTEYDMLLQFADKAMYQAKEQGKNCFIFHDVKL